MVKPLEDAMQNWEYCAVAGVTISSGGRLHAARERTIHYFNERGVRIVNVNIEDENALGLAIAGMGAEGWEMVGCGNTGPDNHILYFKRPIQQTGS
jgi:hypothetical protein